MSLPIRIITDAYAVAPQLQPEDMQVVAEAGFKSVIIHRPDGEGGAEQPAAADVMAAARAAGLEVEYQPVVSGALTLDDVERLRELLQRLPAPVLAFCRSGARSTQLFNALTEN